MGGNEGTQEIEIPSIISATAKAPATAKRQDA
jgi:hypothetical protein